MSSTPEDFIEQVVDRATFVEFLRLLCEDWYREEEMEKAQPSPPYSAGALGWENGSIGAFLDAASAFGDSMAARASPVPANPWRAAAEIILAGKWYE